MYSVTGRIKMVKQPYGGYLKYDDFELIQLDDGLNIVSCYKENVSSGIVGMAVDYMTRFMFGASPEKAFEISLMGADIINEKQIALEKLNNISGLNKKSIINACNLAEYDVYYRTSAYPYRPYCRIPNQTTINNITIMVNRCIDFFEKYGPITMNGFTLDGGYTNIISSGDGDYLTKDALWDLKVSKNSINNSNNRLQLLVYYIMGCHSVYPEFQNVKKLGFYNPRLNRAYTMNIANIDQSIIDEVSKSVIGY